MYDITQKVLSEHFPAHTGAIYCIRFVPNTEDHHIITGSSDGTIRVWDLEGNELKLFKGHFRSVIDLDFTFYKDKLYLASASEDRSVKIWDYDSEKVYLNLVDADNVVKTVRFGHNNKIITGSKDKHLRIYDLEFKGETIDIEIGNVTALAIHPQSDICAVATSSNNIEILDYIEGEITHTLKGHTLPVQGLDFSSDGKLLISSSLNKNITIYDLTSGFNELITFKAHNSAVTSVKFFPNGDSFASCSFDRSVRIFEPGSVKHKIQFRGPKLAITDIHFNADGTKLAFSSADGSFRIQDVSDKNSFFVKKSTKDYFSSLTTMQNGQKLVAGRANGAIKIFDTSLYKEEKFVDEAHVGPITKIKEYIKDNQEYILTAGEDKTLKLWDNNLEIVNVGEGHSVGIKDVIVYDDFAVSVSPDSKIMKWKLPELELIGETKTHKYSVNSVELSNDAQYIATTSNDTRAVLHDIDLNPKLTYKGHSDSIMCSAFSKSDKWLFTGSKIGEIIIFEVEKEKIFNTLHANTDEIVKISFSPNFEILVVISIDNKMSIYSYSEDNEGIFTLTHIHQSILSGNPTDVCWIPEPNQVHSKFLLSTILGELIEFSILKSDQSAPVE